PAFFAAAVLFRRILPFLIIGQFVVRQPLVRITRFALSALALLLRIQFLVVPLRPARIGHIVILSPRSAATLRLPARVLLALLSILLRLLLVFSGLVLQSVLQALPNSLDGLP